MDAEKRELVEGVLKLRWEGWGRFAPLISLVFYALILLSIDGVMGDGYVKEHDWPETAAVFTVGVLLWIVGRRLNTPGERKIIERGELKKIWHEPSHSLFGLRIEYWSFLAFGIGLYRVFFMS